MKERPILFSAPMVRAILAGTKTQTRRVVMPQPHPRSTNPGGRVDRNKCRYGVQGDLLWVRETWREGDYGSIFYRADEEWDKEIGWKPSIFMPRTHSRITLEVTGVLVERVQSISHADAKAEGVYSEFMKKATRETIPPMTGPRDSPLSQKVAYRWLWDSLNAKRGFGWDKNPWVFAITFKRILP